MARAPRSRRFAAPRARRASWRCIAPARPGATCCATGDPIPPADRFRRRRKSRRSWRVKLSHPPRVAAPEITRRPKTVPRKGAFLFAALACLLLLRHSTMGTANRPDSSSAAVVKTSPVVLFANTTATTLGVDLEAAGFTVAHAESGAEAVANTRKLLPDAILVSPDLPDMDGADVCERVRAELPSLTVPMIIVATDPPAAARRIAALRAGAWDYLRYPEDLEE